MSILYRALQVLKHSKYTRERMRMPLARKGIHKRKDQHMSADTQSHKYRHTDMHM